MAVNLGYGNRHVLDAMRRQMEKTTFAYRLHFENEPAEELARQLAARMPAGLDRMFFVSGGSEATESAMKIADHPVVLMDGFGHRRAFLNRDVLRMTQLFLGDATDGRGHGRRKERRLTF